MATTMVADESSLSVLNITNIEPDPLVCTALPEYDAEKRRSGPFYMDPTSCARSTQVRILSASNDDVRPGTVGIRSQLRHALSMQRSTIFSSWWCDGSSISALQCSVKEWVDSLDTTGCLAHWPLEAITPLIRSYCEQQRVRTCCTVMVLADVEDAALHWFFHHVCPAWGAIIFVLPAYKLTSNGGHRNNARLLSIARDHVAEAEIITEFPLVALAADVAPEDVPEQRVQTLWVPHFLSTSLGEGLKDVDDSYLVKYMRTCGQRPALLRLVFTLMKLAEIDAYEAFHAVDACRGELCKLPQSPPDVEASSVLRALVDKSPDEWIPQWRMLSLVPPMVPAVLFRDDFVAFLVDSGLSCHLSGGKSAFRLLNTPPWITFALSSVYPDEVHYKGAEILLERIAKLDAVATSLSVDGSNSVLYKLHDVIANGPKRVSGSAIRTVQDVQQHHVDVAVADAELFANEDDGPAAFSSDENREVVIAQGWLRRRTPMLEYLMQRWIYPHRWYFPLHPTLPSCHVAPSVRRGFDELLFGIPVLPHDDRDWCPELASLYLCYADHFRSKGDYLQAAASTERALCIYLHFFDTAATAATDQYAALIAPKISANAEKLLRRKSTMAMVRRNSSRRSMDGTNNDDTQSIQSGASQSMMRKMSRLTQMSAASSKREDELGIVDDHAYAHIVSLLLLGIESIYRRLADDYCQANVQGVSVPLLDRGIATLELLNMSRRDTPARAVTSFRKGEKELLLSNLEHRRGKTIQHAPELQEDEGDMKLRALVRADVEERHHLRSAAGEMKECLGVLEVNHCPRLTSDIRSKCHEVISRQYLTDVNDKDSAEHAEGALDVFLESLDSGEDGYTPISEIIKASLCSNADQQGGASPPEAMVMKINGCRFRSLQEDFQWVLMMVPTFLDAIESSDYSLANEFLDRSPLFSCLGALPNELVSSRSLAPDVILCAHCGDHTEQVLNLCFPEPGEQPHLQLYTSFSDAQVAGHHGMDWKKTPVAYRLPLHSLIRTTDRTNEIKSEDAMRLLKRLVEEFHVNPLCCSPHDMKTALHLAISTRQADLVQYFLQHPLVDPMVTSPHVMTAERRNLSTVPTIDRVTNPNPSPILSCPPNDNSMLLLLLTGSKDPHFTFKALKIYIVERLAQDPDGKRMLSSILSTGSIFASELQGLLVCNEVSSETRELLAQLCSWKQLIWGLESIKDPHVVLALCVGLTHWGDEGAASLKKYFVERVEAEDYPLGRLLLQRFSQHLRVEDLPYEACRDYRLWLGNTMPKGSQLDEA